MALINDIVDFVTQANDLFASLSDSIIARQSQSILLSDPCSANPPSVTANGLWTLSQDTADTDGIYKGIYQFALNTACSVLMIQSVTGHTTPANTTFPPARYTDCEDVVHDLTSVNDLTNKQVKHFEIYSDSAFSITLTVSATWEKEWDFTVEDGYADGWLYVNDHSEGWFAGLGHRSEDVNIGDDENELLYMGIEFPASTLTHFEIETHTYETDTTFDSGRWVSALGGDTFMKILVHLLII